MKYTEGNRGRIFIMRLEDGDVIPQTLEEFASAKNIRAALVFFLGGAQKGSKVIVGPEDNTEDKPIPMVEELEGISEAVGVGTMFRNEAGEPRLHMHAAFGRKNKTVTGCTRAGVNIWNVGEVVIMEITGTGVGRKVNPQNGFELLEL